MSLIKWEPLAETDRLMNSLLNGSFWRMPRSALAGSAEVQWAPTADISETPSEFRIRAELPAVPKEAIKVQIEDGTITIEGERKYTTEEKDEKQHRTESFQGRFSRSFSLPANVDPATISAESKDGVLTVHLPKKKVTTPAPVQVKVG